MKTARRHNWRDRHAFARPLFAVVLGLEAVHVAVLLLLPHPVMASNTLQLCFPLLIAAVSVHQSWSAKSKLGRRSWYLLASAFAIWAVAQALYLYYLNVPYSLKWAVRPDDVLWLLFGLPLLVCITTTHNELDKVSWFDRMQTILFVAVLYCLVFLSKGRLDVTRAFLIQNLALILCCFLRFPACTMARERHFFTRLSIFLVAYTVLECLGELLYSRGWQPGSAVDLVWTVPFALLLLLILRDADAVARIDAERNRVSKTMRTLQGLSVAAVTFLSMALAATLARFEPVLGGLLLALSFGLFAFRTSLREKLWNAAHDRLEETVLQDSLTGLGNRLQLRRALEERLAWKDRERPRVLLLFADLDRFKGINDSLGHALGDRVLIEVGRRLSAAASPGSVVCRLGGDEFVVLSPTVDAEQPHVAGERLLRALQAPFLLGKHELRCTASIGVVQAEGGENADDLLRTADHAMYRAKQVGRDRVQVFDAALYADLSNSRQMETDLRACIAEKSIGIAFQPIYSVSRSEICGFEALARWSHPVLGNVPPLEFITLAERSGMISALGAQILDKACTQMASWNRTWGTNLSVSVNVSAHQFADTALMPSVLRILERTGLPASLLRLEITETALLLDQAMVRQTLEQARSHGIHISLDDFGTGYSSLSFLLSLPVDEVKVDRSFVSDMKQDPHRKELVRTVVHLGHTLGKTVVAEGVETEQDLLSLAEMGCECVQGYFISKPLSPEAIDADPPPFGSGVSSQPPGDSSRLRKTGPARVSPDHEHSSRPAPPSLQPALRSEVVNSC